MSRIVLATASADFERRVLDAADGNCVSLPLGPLPSDPAGLFAQLDIGPRPEVVVLDSGSELEQALDLAARFDQQCPGISVVLVTELYLEIGLEAMRVGVRDMLHPEMEGLDISLVLERAVAAAQASAVELETGSGGSSTDAATPSRGAGRVITVGSPKGGVGKTLVATNLAVGLAQLAPQSTVLVDLDLQFGDVSSALRLEPEYGLLDAVRGPATADTMVLKTFLSLHETGLYVICGTDRPAAADSITGTDVGQLLRMLATEFQYVVVDTTAGLSEHVLAAMDETTDLVLVTSMDVPGARGLRKELDALAELAMAAETRHLVLNFSNRRGGLTRADVEATLRTPVDVLLPSSAAALASTNSGVPVLESGLKDPLTRALRQLVSRFAAGAEPAARRGARSRRATASDDDLAEAARPRRSRFGRAMAS